MKNQQKYGRFSLATLALVITVAMAAHAQFSVLYNLGSASKDPFAPNSSGIIAQGRDGSLYTTSQFGGASQAYGAIFKITTAGKLKTIWSFTGGADGGTPVGGLTLGTDGNFYGTTEGTGGALYGTVFKVTSGGHLVTLYKFTGGNDGYAPDAPPVEGPDGIFYGTTVSGGSSSCACGTVYKITPNGTLFTPLYQFDNTTGSRLYAPLVLGIDGYLYGTTSGGGTAGFGVIFKISTDGKLTVLHDFDGSDGKTVYSPLIQASDGNFYGTTEGDQLSGTGEIFMMTPTGELSVLHPFNGTTDGENPFAGLVEATDGNFYGASGYGGNSSVYPGARQALKVVLFD